MPSAFRFTSILDHATPNCVSGTHKGNEVPQEKKKINRSSHLLLFVSGFYIDGRRFKRAHSGTFSGGAVATDFGNFGDLGDHTFFFPTNSPIFTSGSIFGCSSLQSCRFFHE